MPENPAAVLSTTRLRLEPLTPGDLAAVHAIYTDPGTWRHLPTGRHTSLASTERTIHESERGWATSGLGRWAIRLRSDLPRTGLPGTALPGTDLAAGTLIGVASAMLMDCGARNLGYRLTPASWGVGLATEAATAVLAAASSSTFPVTARALAANPASVRVLERIGLTRLWSGSGVPGIAAAQAGGEPAAGSGHPDTTALERVVFADRALAPDLLAAIIRLG